MKKTIFLVSLFLSTYTIAELPTQAKHLPIEELLHQKLTNESTLEYKPPVKKYSFKRYGIVNYIDGGVMIKSNRNLLNYRPNFGENLFIGDGVYSSNGIALIDFSQKANIKLKQYSEMNISSILKINDEIIIDIYLFKGSIEVNVIDLDNVKFNVKTHNKDYTVKESSLEIEA